MAGRFVVVLHQERDSFEGIPPIGVILRFVVHEEVCKTNDLVVCELEFARVLGPVENSREEERGGGDFTVDRKLVIESISLN